MSSVSLSKSSDKLHDTSYGVASYYTVRKLLEVYEQGTVLSVL